jgi:predicted NBD/HSP70 family sugar kinase
LAIAVFSAGTPSCSGLTLVSASRDDLSAATSAQAAAGVAAADIEVVGAAAVAGGLAWLGAELPPQLARAQSRATDAAALITDRRAQRNRIWVFPQEAGGPPTLHPGNVTGLVDALDSQRIAAIDALPPRLADETFSPCFYTPIVRAAHGDSSGVRGAAWLWR